MTDKERIELLEKRVKFLEKRVEFLGNSIASLLKELNRFADLLIRKCK